MATCSESIKYVFGKSIICIIISWDNEMIAIYQYMSNNIDTVCIFRCHLHLPSLSFRLLDLLNRLNRKSFYCA